MSDELSQSWTVCGWLGGGNKLRADMRETTLVVVGTAYCTECTECTDCDMDMDMDKHRHFGALTLIYLTASDTDTSC